MKPDPRITSVKILDTLETGRQTLDVIVGTALDSRLLPDKRDRALVTALVYGVLRRRLTLDWVIGQLSTTPFDRIEPTVRTILRLGLYQILFMDRIPVYAAVDSAVRLTKTMSVPRLANYVNGVLRAAVRRRESLSYPDQADDPVKWLSVTRSFPEWMVNRWIARLGMSETVRYCDMINRIPSITVRVNTLKTVYARARSALAAAVEKMEDGRFAPAAISFSSPRGAVDDLACFADGWFQVQSESAQLSCLLLDPQPKERILDAFAGLGGKTGYMAQLMNNNGRILAADADGRKLKSLDDEMKRLGVSIAETRRIDWLKNAPGTTLKKFDRVLADCPCSGMGVIRRNPDIKWSADPRQPARHRKNQVRLLSVLADYVRTGGFLVYVVCSTEPEENEQVIDLFLKSHKNFAVDTDLTGTHTAVRQFTDNRGCFKTPVYPHGLDGFFGIRLKKNGK